MPDTPSTLIHFRWPDKTGAPAACGSSSRFKSDSPGEVTCFACRRTPVFTEAQRHPLPQRVAPAPLTPPVKLSGVMTRHPVMAEMYAEAIRRGEETPHYLHSCSDCEYLGHTNNSHSDGTIKRVELYYCHAPEEGDVLARHSSGQGDWVRGYTRATWDPDLALAVVRSISKGLLKANALGKFNL